MFLFDNAFFDQHTAELATATLLRFERLLQLLLRDQLLRDKHVAETDFLRTPHRRRAPLWHALD